MNILVVNAGSSSLKYQLFDTVQNLVLAKGTIEKIGLNGSSINHQVHEEFRDEQRIEYQDRKKTVVLPIPDHSAAIGLMVDVLTDPKDGIIKSLEEIDAVGHRIVHGGSLFDEAIEITDEVIERIESLNELAPLHNPPALLGIKACQEAMPHVTNVAVFDTAFHQTMPDTSYVYPIGYDMYEKYGIRRFGFHGTSHRYVFEKAVDHLDKPFEDTKVITCHLGNGSSMAAIVGGKVIDTTMGFTPLSGLMMGTRSGDIDPALIPYIMEKEGMDVHQVINYLNKRSGMLGVSGVSSDLRDIYEAMEIGDERAALAIKMCQQRVIKYIGAYIAEMNGADAIVFTAGIGENDVSFRRAVCENLTNLGVEIDLVKNNCQGVEREITLPSSRIRVFVIPTNEELMIARDTRAIMLKKRSRKK